LGTVIAEQRTVPDIVICCAGGTPPATLGFLAELDSEQLKVCFESNYYSALFTAQKCLQLWISNPKPDRTRHIVFIASAAAFAGIPGYAAYTPSKTALRALADTLRMELLLYGDNTMYQVHCAFPGIFLTDAFKAQEENKPKLTKMMEGSDYTTEELVKNTQSVEAVANRILLALENGRFFITTDMKTDLILNNMRGPSPRDSSIYDMFMGFIAMIAWPFVRRRWEATVTDYRFKRIE
jgi:3-dehydrosphinganine reductase